MEKNPQYAFKRYFNGYYGCAKIHDCTFLLLSVLFHYQVVGPSFCQDSRCQCMFPALHTAGVEQSSSSGNCCQDSNKLRKAGRATQQTLRGNITTTTQSHQINVLFFCSTN